MLSKTVLISLMLLLAGVTDAAPMQANGRVRRACVKKNPAAPPAGSPNLQGTMLPNMLTVPTAEGQARGQANSQAAPLFSPEVMEALKAPPQPVTPSPPPANNAAPPAESPKPEPKKEEPQKEGGSAKDNQGGQDAAGVQPPPNGVSPEAQKAQPKDAPAGTNFKRGFSFPAQEPDAAPVKQFFENGSKLSWWYNWSKSASWMPQSEGIKGEFLSMVWGPNSLYEGTNEGADPKTLFPGDAKIVMGFNEPDNKNPATGSGMEVGQAVELWKKMFDAGRAANPKMEFASPGMMTDKQWLRDFFGGICPGGLKGCNYAPQYLAVHDYVPDGDQFIKNIEGWRNDFPDLPMIVTEFACANFGEGDQPDDAKVNAYMDKVIPWLDSTDYIYRYAWFTATRDPAKMYGVSKPNSLLNEQGGLTDLGKKYMSM